MSNNKAKFGFNATWSMAVGGMVGGGIFSEQEATSSSADVRGLIPLQSFHF
jgi:hypothetical protein